MKYLSFAFFAVSLLLLSSCKEKSAGPANKATAQGGVTIINSTAYPLSIHFRAHDTTNPGSCMLESGAVYINAQSTVSFNSPADLNATPGWFGSFSNYYTAPGDWDGIKGGFPGFGGDQIGNFSSCMTDSSWSEYYPNPGITLHLTWRHVNGVYELRAF
jgi:hypothetical protein